MIIRSLAYMLVTIATFICLAQPQTQMLGANKIKTAYQANDEATAADYVQDGLVCMWDAIENAGYGMHDDVATYWVNLVDGSIDQMQGKFASDYEWTSNAFVKLAYGNSKFYSDKTLQLLQAFQNCTFTVEQVTSKPLTDKTWILQTVNIAQSLDEAYHKGIYCLVRTLNDKGECYIGDTVYVKYGVYGYETMIQVPNEPTTWTSSFDEGYGTFYLDGNYCKSGITSPDKSINAVIIRFPASSYGFIGYYHCLRIYNRQLTEKEISHNAQIDRKRFGL